MILPKPWLFLRELSKELLEQGCFVKVRWFGIHCCRVKLLRATLRDPSVPGTPSELT